MHEVKVLSIQRVSTADRQRIEAVDPAIRFTDAGGWFDGEYRDTWPAFAVSRYVARNSTGQGTREERDRLLAEADVVLGGWPFPLDLRARAKRLKWFHQRPAGASNLLLGDLWGSDVTVTTSRGAGNTLAMAEYAVAGILHFAKSLHRAVVDRGAGASIRGPTGRCCCRVRHACVVGAGGIGVEVGRLCAALGMHVVGTRRRMPALGRCTAGWVQPDRRSRQPRRDAAGQRFRRDLLPVDAGDDASVQPRALCPDEAGRGAGQCRARRDHRRGGADRGA